MFGAFLVVLSFFLGYVMGAIQFKLSHKAVRLVKKTQNKSELLTTPSVEDVKIAEEKDFWSKIK
tara:strand:- start:38 stop:229 length:192 start_codon:yes stop_codon:yes gene_type:complete